ncbi:MAG: Mur ligase family protein, partial [Candidatus Coproplasma sp.]
MRFGEVLKDIQCEKVTGNTNVEINGLSTDPDTVSKGNLFIAYKGANFDLNEHIDKAVKNGAAAVVCERAENCPVPCVVVKDGRAAVAYIARTYYGYADRRLKLIAVTGTNGKTSTCYMLKSIFDKNGNKTGVIGTLGIVYGDIFIAPELTTPDPICLHGVFADMAASGVEYVFMEVSAHALYFDKVCGLHFEVGIFTNCTQDHLDFFKDMKSYAKNKLKLFERGRCKRVIVNSDDALGIKIMQANPDCLTYGLENPADSFAVNITEALDGSTFVINLSDELYDVKLNMPARYNVYNALA